MYARAAQASRERTVQLLRSLPSSYRAEVLALIGSASDDFYGVLSDELDDVLDRAETIVAAMEKGAYRVTLGKDAAFLDKFVRVAPEKAMEFIEKKMADLLKG